MPRPYRPNPLPKGADRMARRKTHVKQETGPERKLRLREEAEDRHEEHVRECIRRDREVRRDRRAST